jgi:RNA polymerase sigma-70 factor (ECF subfamily)
MQIEHFDRYLLRSVRNEAQNLSRARRRRWQRDLAAVGLSTTADHPGDADVLRAVAALTVRQRSVVFLAYWLDLTEADIAATLAVSTGTVHRTLSRARTQLRKALR